MASSVPVECTCGEVCPGWGRALCLGRGTHQRQGGRAGVVRVMMMWLAQRERSREHNIPRPHRAPKSRTIPPSCTKRNTPLPIGESDVPGLPAPGPPLPPRASVGTWAYVYARRLGPTFDSAPPRQEPFPSCRGVRYRQISGGDVVRVVDGMEYKWGGVGGMAGSGRHCRESEL